MDYFQWLISFVNPLNYIFDSNKEENKKDFIDIRGESILLLSNKHGRLSDNFPNTTFKNYSKLKIMSYEETDFLILTNHINRVYNNHGEPYILSDTNMNLYKSYPIIYETMRKDKDINNGYKLDSYKHEKEKTEFDKQLFYIIANSNCVFIDVDEYIQLCDCGNSYNFIENVNKIIYLFVEFHKINCGDTFKLPENMEQRLMIPLFIRFDGNEIKRCHLNKAGKVGWKRITNGIDNIIIGGNISYFCYVHKNGY